ncbi:MAG TPA: alkaline phosphatase family protein [Acidimicrobiia bacterium]|jgi:phospholipase C|nr:alkaline phosphatase family protein [Acidimicrobiia bacterium]
MTDDRADSGLSRRELLARGAGLAGVAGVASLLGTTGSSAADMLLPRRTALPQPKKSGIEHVVVVMMENRSFDHFLGWLPGANGTQAGLSFADPAGKRHRTQHLTEWQGCGHPDPDHSWDGGRTQLNGGACDGWLLGANDEYSIGYYKGADLDFYRHAAPYWTVCDKYFAAIMASTYPNRFFMHAAQTDRLNNGGTYPTTLPTIWDSLAAADVSAAYYYTDLPFIALWGSKYSDITHPYTQFQDDCASGNLPAVSFVDPKFLDEGSGTAGDDHPHSDIRVGQYWLNQVYDAITNSPAWDSTVLVINYDEWGGFFDHVRPRKAPDANPDARLRGFRVPAFVISPFARRHHVAHDLYDHTSVLKMIEWRWGLEPLTVRDAAANNIAEVLDFKNRDLHAPKWNVPEVVGVACPEESAEADFEDWLILREHAERSGFDLPTHA